MFRVMDRVKDRAEVRVRVNTYIYIYIYIYVRLSRFETLFDGDIVLYCVIYI